MKFRKNKNKQQGRTKSILFKSGNPKKKKSSAGVLGPSLKSMLKGLGIVGTLCGIVIGLVFLERYVGKTSSASKDDMLIELVDVPVWVSEPLKEKVYAVAKGYGENPIVDEDAALSVQHQIVEQIPWLDDVKVRINHGRLYIAGRWRQPVALIKSGPFQFYVDVEQVALDYVPMPHLTIVEVTGLSSIITVPPLGDVWPRNDLAAAIQILDRLHKMDETQTPDKPLLKEIDRIDVSNYKGRQNSNQAHIILYSKDNTEILWGAEIGTWQRHLES
ncbi:MAG: hypothetical protein JXM79_16000, partial [Sedimentisphaerales bacterium]|nr:hypothetical protein [Sedimentisphaerales bacterium]